MQHTSNLIFIYFGRGTTIIHAFDLAVFMADDFNRIDLVQLVKFADTSFDQFDQYEGLNDGVACDLDG